MQFKAILSTLLFASVALSAPVELERRLTAVTNVKCTGGAALDFHDSNVAQLKICGGIQGAIQKCQGNPTSTEGVSNGVKFTIKPAIAGDTINVSKGRWEQGIKAAFQVCGQNKPFTAQFDKGATKGNINVTYGPA